MQAIIPEIFSENGNTLLHLTRANSRLMNRPRKFFWIFTRFQFIPFFGDNFTISLKNHSLSETGLKNPCPRISESYRQFDAHVV